MKSINKIRTVAMVLILSLMVIVQYQGEANEMVSFNKYAVNVDLEMIISNN